MNTNTSVVEEPTEVLSVGDTVKVLDSPVNRIKKSAKGKVVKVVGDFATDKTVMLTVNFRVNREDFPVYADSKRFTFVSHNEADELPDAENMTVEGDSDDDDDETPSTDD